jgi:hypothetical protein
LKAKSYDPKRSPSQDEKLCVSIDDLDQKLSDENDQPPNKVEEAFFKAASSLCEDPLPLNLTDASNISALSPHHKIALSIYKLRNICQQDNASPKDKVPEKDFSEEQACALARQTTEFIDDIVAAPIVLPSSRNSKSPPLERYNVATRRFLRQADAICQISESKQEIDSAKASAVFFLIGAVFIVGCPIGVGLKITIDTLSLVIAAGLAVYARKKATSPSLLVRHSIFSQTKEVTEEARRLIEADPTRTQPKPIPVQSRSFVPSSSL